MNLIFTKLSLALFCAFPLPKHNAQPNEAQPNVPPSSNVKPKSDQSSAVQLEVPPSKFPLQNDPFLKPLQTSTLQSQIPPSKFSLQNDVFLKPAQTGNAQTNAQPNTQTGNAQTNAQQTTLSPSGSELLPFVPGRFAAYMLLDADSHNAGKLLFRYDKDVAGNYKMEKYDATGHLRRSADGKLECTGNTTGGDWTPKLLDVYFAYKDKNINLQSNDLRYPSAMSVGDALPNGYAHLVISDKWRQNIDIEILATERRVESQELVPAAGNSYLCYRVTYLQTVKTRTNNQNSVPVEFRQTEWIAPTIGIVKTTTVSVTTGKIISGAVLSQLANELPPPAIIENNIPQDNSGQNPPQNPPTSPNNSVPH